MRRYGMIGYLVHREGAKRLVANSEKGFVSQPDAHVYFTNRGCTTAEERVTHPQTSRQDPHSIRQFLNGQVDHYVDYH